MLYWSISTDNKTSSIQRDKFFGISAKKLSLGDGSAVTSFCGGDLCYENPQKTELYEILAAGTMGSSLESLLRIRGLELNFKKINMQ